MHVLFVPSSNVLVTIACLSLLEEWQTEQEHYSFLQNIQLYY